MRISSILYSQGSILSWPCILRLCIVRALYFQALFYRGLYSHCLYYQNLYFPLTFPCTILFPLYSKGPYVLRTPMFPGSYIFSLYIPRALYFKPLRTLTILSPDISSNVYFQSPYIPRPYTSPSQKIGIL